MKSSSPNPSTKKRPTANSFTLSPRQKWWLRTELFVPELLLQLSRAQLPAIFYHLPSKTAFSQHTRLKQHIRLCHPRHTVQRSHQGDSPWLEATSVCNPKERDPCYTALERLQGQPLPTGLIYPRQQGPHVSLHLIPSPVLPCEYFVFTEYCSSAMGLLFPMSHYCRGDHSVSCGCSAASTLLHSFLSPKLEPSLGVGRVDRLVQKLRISEYCLQPIQS